MSVLLIAEHNNKDLKPFTLNAITAASQIDQDLHVLVIGNNADSVAKSASTVPAVKKVIHIDGDDLRDVLDNKDYSEKGRRKNIQFAINMAKVLESKGYVVVVSMVSPYRDLRCGEVFWINSTRPTDREKYWVDNFEPPLKDFYMVDTTDQSIEESVNEILDVCR